MVGPGLATPLTRGGDKMKVEQDKEGKHIHACGRKIFTKMPTFA